MRKALITTFHQQRHTMIRQSSIIALAVTLMAGSAASSSFAGEVTDEQRKKIIDAAPEKAPAEVKQPRRLLVFSRTTGYRHSSIPQGVEAMKILGEKSKAFTIEHSEDPAIFTAEKLKSFDAVLFLNTTGDPAPDEAQRKALEDFVRGGKGIAGIHAATDAGYNWPTYGEMMGGYFDGHPWHEKVTLKVEDPDHALCKCFKGDHLEVVDEIYQFRDKPYSRQNLHILTSLNTKLTNMEKGGIKRKDGDFAVSWIREFGKGRVFYCSLGHREEIYWNPVVLEHYLAGLQYAFGDLKADATPSAEKAIKEVSHYQIGQPRDAFERLEGIVRTSLDDETKRAALEKQLVAVMADPNTTFEGKQFVARQLWIIGSDASVPTLAKMLDDDEMNDLARYAMERMSSKSVDDALIAALKSTQGRNRLGVISTIGRRGHEGAEEALMALAKNNDETGQAAVNALGLIASPKAARILNALPLNQSHVADALLQCGDAMLESGDAQPAKDIYQKVFNAGDLPKAPRIAALRGLISADPAGTVPLVAELLESDDAAMQEAAARFVRQIDDEQLINGFAEKLPSLPASSQALLIAGLSESGSGTLGPAFIKAMEHGTPAVRMAAYEGLARLQNPANAVPPLIKAAATANGEEAKAAESALTRMRGQSVADALAAAASDGSVNERTTAIEIIAARKDSSAAPALAKAAAGGGDIGVRVAALKALRVVGGAEEYPAVVNVFVTENDEQVVNNARAALVTIARRMNDDEAAAKPLADAMSSADDAKKADLLAALGSFDGDTAGLAMITAYGSNSPSVQDAAVRAMSGSNNTHVIDTLRKVAASGNDKHRALALRGAVKLIPRSSIKPEAKIDILAQMLKDTDDVNEKKMIVSSLAQVPHQKSLGLAKSLAQDESLKNEAEQAARQIEAALSQPPVATASHGQDRVGYAFDGNAGTRWDTGTPMRPGMWFMIDFHAPRTVSKITLDTRGSSGDFPRGYEVYAGDNAGNLGNPVVKSNDGSPVTVITFEKPVTAQFIKIVQTGSVDGLFWSIHEMTIE